MGTNNELRNAQIDAAPFNQGPDPVQLVLWGVALAGMLITTILCLVGAGLIALCNSTMASIDHVMSSPMLIGSWLMVGGVLAPLVGGYTAARIARRKAAARRLVDVALAGLCRLLRHLGPGQRGYSALARHDVIVLGAGPGFGRRVSLPVARHAPRCRRSSMRERGPIKKPGLVSPGSP